MSAAEVALAALNWCYPEKGGEGQWTLHLVSDEWALSPVVATWPESAGPPPLLDRYDALSALGYAVVEGGPEAWKWEERLDEDGQTFLFAYTAVRPLALEDVATG